MECYMSYWKYIKLSQSLSSNISNVKLFFQLAAVKKQTNLSLLQGLLDDVELALREGYYYHVGSQALWQHHGDMVVRMKNRLNALELTQVSTYTVFPLR